MTRELRCCATPSWALSNLIYRFSAIALRGANLIVRFGLAILVARTLDVEQAGFFFLYLAGVQTASNLLPMDMYASTARAVLRTKTGEQDGAHAEINRHFGAVLMLSAIFGPVAGAVFYVSSPSVGFGLAFLFFLHAALEAFINDTGRLLVPLSRPLHSAAYLFLRSAIWIAPAFLLLEMGLWRASATGLAIFWLGSSFVMAVIGTMIIGRAVGTPLKVEFDFGWVILKLKYSFIFLLGSLAFRFISGGDRFLIERALGLEAVAVYGLYVSVAFGLLALVETGSSAWSYPGLVRAVQEKDKALVYQVFIPYLWQNTLGSLILTLLLVISFSLMPAGFVDPVYLESVRAFQLICLGVFFLCVSLPFHYLIYGYGMDIARLISMFFGAITMITAWAALLPEAGLLGAAIMLAAALGAIGLYRILLGTFLLFAIRRWPSLSVP